MARLRVLGLRPKEEELTKIGYSLDAIVEVNGKQLGVEVDGPSHFIGKIDFENRMRELPYALYDSQEVMVSDIVNTGKGSIKKGLAVLGGIQINTSPTTLDYFHPLRFDYYDENGNLVENMLPYLR